MARLARIVIPGQPHHVTQRGVRRLETFFGDGDYRAYLALLTEWCDKAGTEIWAWCLMPNHVHLVLVPQNEDGLRAALGETHRRYTRRINLREDWRGHLWQERFHSFPMNEDHLLACVRYVELNPVRARLVRQPADWRWSSARAHLGNREDKVTRLAPMLERMPDWKSFLAGGLDDETLEAIRGCTRTGRPMGSENWLKQSEKALGRSLRKAKPGPRCESGN